jgi:flagellin
MSAAGSIMTNSGALSALNSISNTSTTATALEGELASGKSINSPADNPAGYITAQGFTSQINGINQAISNANQGVSLLQTAQGAITQQIGVVQQLNSIAVQAANGTQTSSESQSLQNVVGQLTSQVTTIANQTQFNNISLLNGSFNGVQFQTGANEGQTMTLSIGNTAASAIGMDASTASSAGVYSKAHNKSSASAAVTLGAPAVGTGAFSSANTAATELKVTGNTGGSASFATTAGESAASLASAVNNVSATTGVQAQATNSITLKLSNAVAGSGYSFKIQASKGSASASGIGSSEQINAASASQIVSQVNSNSSTSGIIASLDSSGNLVLTQSAGENINITNTTAGSLTTTGSAPTTIKTGAGTASATIQGQVQFQSSGAFTLGNAGNVGLNSNSKLYSLANINVSTTTGANQAINVVKYSLNSLNNEGGQLGAVQQGLTANINNMSTTSENLQTALGVVQDANIPQVTNQLTETQIQAQAGVSALKSSTQIQQSYLSLLP